MINMIKKLCNIRFPNKTFCVSAQKTFYPLNCSNKALIFSARPSIKDKCFVVNWHEEFIQKTVNHSVSYACARDESSFIIVDKKMVVTTMSIVATDKFTI